jgi:DNA-directed RNA polymerase subunit RPC12/RpoP
MAKRRYLKQDKKKELLESAEYTCSECEEKVTLKNAKFWFLNWKHIGEEELDIDVEILCENCFEWKNIEKGKGYGEYKGY